MEQNRNEEKTRKKVYRFMTAAMSITTSTILSFYNITESGHFAVSLLLISIVISSTLSILLGYLIPTKKISDEVTSNISRPVLRHIVSNVLTGSFYSIIITTVLSFIMVGMANAGFSNNIDELHLKVNSLADLISAQEQALAAEDPSSERYAELTESVSKLRNEAEQIMLQIHSMEDNRPNPFNRLPKTILAGLLISWCIGIFIQPVYLKIAFIIFNVNNP